MPNPWDDLPNAKHIDFVLEHMKQHLHAWCTASYSIRTTPITSQWEKSWKEAFNVIHNTSKEDIKDKIWPRAEDISNSLNAAWDSVTDVLMALIAYDDCAHLLYSDPKEVEVLARLGVSVAVLLLPGATAINSCKTEQ